MLMQGISIEYKTNNKFISFLFLIYPLCKILSSSINGCSFFILNLSWMLSVCRNILSIFHSLFKISIWFMVLDGIFCFYVLWIVWLEISKPCHKIYHKFKEPIHKTIYDFIKNNNANTINELKNEFPKQPIKEILKHLKNEDLIHFEDII